MPTDSLPPRTRSPAQQQILDLSDDALVLIQELMEFNYRLGFDYGIFIETHRDVINANPERTTVDDKVRLDNVLRRMPTNEFRAILTHRYQNEQPAV